MFSLDYLSVLCITWTEQKRDFERGGRGVAKTPAVTSYSDGVICVWPCRLRLQREMPSMQPYWQSKRRPRDLQVRAVALQPL